MRNDIVSNEDIVSLVNAFYSKVRQDDLLAGIFNDRINDRWPEHLRKMVCFWQTVLFNERSYYGSPFTPHAKLPVEEIHFRRWISLFYDTVDENFCGPKAEETKWRANKMKELFQHKIAYYRNHPDKHVL